MWDETDGGTVTDIAELRGPVLVTGTDTGVGKTIVTAAVAAVAAAAGARVAVLKLAQTGADDDARTVAQLAAPATAQTLASYPDPLAPLTAARTSGQPPLPADQATQAVRDLASDHDLVLVEGAGGLLVPMGVHPASQHPWTVAELAMALGMPALVVVQAGLGTLNHTALTVEALERRSVVGRVVIGAWPREPELVHRTNLTDLAAIAHLVGAVPDGAAKLAPEEFRTAAPTWFTVG